MNNTESLGMNFKEQLTNACDKFSEWVTESQIILNSLKNVKDAVNALKELDNAPVELLKVTDDTATADEIDKYSFVDTLEIDLRNNIYFDVSQWEDNVKPVKAILSVYIPEKTTYGTVNEIAKNWDKLGKTGGFDVKLTIGNMILLMEDGTFRTRE